MDSTGLFRVFHQHRNERFSLFNPKHVVLGHLVVCVVHEVRIGGRRFGLHVPGSERDSNVVGGVAEVQDERGVLACHRAIEAGQGLHCGKAT